MCCSRGCLPVGDTIYCLQTTEYVLQETTWDLLSVDMISSYIRVTEFHKKKVRRAERITLKQKYIVRTLCNGIVNFTKMLLVHLCVIAALTIACSTYSVESWRIHDSISRRSVNENRSAKSWKILASALLSVSAWNIAVGESLPVLAVSGGGKDYGNTCM